VSKRPPVPQLGRLPRSWRPLADTCALLSHRHPRPARCGTANQGRGLRLMGRMRRTRRPPRLMPELFPMMRTNYACFLRFPTQHTQQIRVMVNTNGPRQVQKAFSGACALPPVAATWHGTTRCLMHNRLCWPVRAVRVVLPSLTCLRTRPQRRCAPPSRCQSSRWHTCRTSGSEQL